MELPIVVFMKFDSNKIAHEHVYWNQTSLLAQICLDLESPPVYDIEQTRKLLEISSQQKRNENSS